MSAIGVIATLRVQPGKQAQFEGVFAELAAAVKWAIRFASCNSAT